MGWLSVQRGKPGMAAISWRTGVFGTLCEGDGWRDIVPRYKQLPESGSDNPQNMPVEAQDTDIIPTAAHSITPGQYTVSLDITLQ